MNARRAVRVSSSQRRGSSWPIVVETEDGRYVTKLRGAGQGAAALVAEIIVGFLADAIGLRVPARSLILVDEALECENRDPELLDLLAASRGPNLGFAWLEGARDLRPNDPREIANVASDEASRIVWLDWLVMNPDRTHRNPNILLWKKEPWLIDHGAALMFHHDWSAVTEDSPRRPMPSSVPHLLWDRAVDLAGWDARLSSRLDRDIIRAAVHDVPDAFFTPLLPGSSRSTTLPRRREAYVAFLWKRLKPPRSLLSSTQPRKEES